MKVRDIMTQDVLTVTAETSVNDVAKLLGQRDIRGVPVVDDQQHVIGIITELDLIVRNTRLEMPHFIEVLDWGRIPLERPSHLRERLQHMLGTEARDVMTEKVVTIGPEASIEELAELMVKQRVNPVPVVDEQGRLIGIVSRADLVDMMAAQLE
ncbi:MAG TPA: CBS domain-containing protein [Anaerolineae bacterium]|nr:CBS domain-containing protein [Anaerolineae bacterium]